MSGKSIKERLSEMSDEELYKLINAVCAAAGLDQVRTVALTSDIPKLRRMIGSLNDRQISNLLASLGGADTGEMLKRLGGG